MPKMKPSLRLTKSPSISTSSPHSRLCASRCKTPGCLPGVLSCRAEWSVHATVMRTVFLVVFGFGVFLVAFGVTDIVTEQEPLPVPRTDVPERLQIFFDAVAIDNVTFAPAGIEIFADEAIFERLTVPPSRTDGDEFDAVGAPEEPDVAGAVVVVVVVVLGAVTKNFGAENEMSLIETIRPAVPFVAAVHLVQAIVSDPRLVVSDFRVMFMRLAIDSLVASALTLNWSFKLVSDSTA